MRKLLIALGILAFAVLALAEVQDRQVAVGTWDKWVNLEPCDAGQITTEIHEGVLHVHCDSQPVDMKEK